MERRNYWRRTNRSSGGWPDRPTYAIVMRDDVPASIRRHPKLLNALLTEGRFEIDHCQR